MYFKKVNLIIAATGLLLTTADARLFNGYSFSGHAGWYYDDVNLKRTLVDGLNLKLKGTNRSNGLVGLQLDFEMSRNSDLYGAVSVSVNTLFDWTPSKRTLYSNVNSALGNGDTLNTLDVRHRNNTAVFGDLTFAAGYNYCGKVVGYALAGARITNQHHRLYFKETVTSPAPVTTTTTYLVGKKPYGMPVVGAGFKTRINNCTSAGLEYKYAWKRAMSYSIPSAEITGRIKSNTHAVLARLSYQFYHL